MRASQRPGASSSFGVGSIAGSPSRRFSPSSPARSTTPSTNACAPLVVRALELQPEQALDEALGLAPLDAVALHRLVDLVERGDEAPADRGEHVVGVALDHRR